MGGESEPCEGLSDDVLQTWILTKGLLIMTTAY